MSRARHSKHEKHRASGGDVLSDGKNESEHPKNAGMNPHIEKIAKEKSSPGYVSGEKAKPRLDRKRGGGVKREHGGGASFHHNAQTEKKHLPHGKAE